MKAKVLAPVKPLSLLAWKLLVWMFKSGTSFRLLDGAPRFGHLEDEITLAASRSALELIDSDYIGAPDEWGNLRLNAAGKAAATSLPKPEWIPPRPPKLTDRDWEVLVELESAIRLRCTHRGEGWATPQDCGGSNGSHHSASLMKLARHGYAMARQSGYQGRTGDDLLTEPSIYRRGKGSRSFALTEAGRRALARHLLGRALLGARAAENA